MLATLTAANLEVPLRSARVLGPKHSASQICAWMAEPPQCRPHLGIQVSHAKGSAWTWSHTAGVGNKDDNDAACGSPIWQAERAEYHRDVQAEPRGLRSRLHR